MRDQTIFTISEKSKRATEQATKLTQVATSTDELNNAYLLAVAGHIGDLKALTQELENEILRETSERKIPAADIAERLHISVSTLFKRWKEIKREK